MSTLCERRDGDARRRAGRRATCTGPSSSAAETSSTSACAPASTGVFTPVEHEAVTVARRGDGGRCAAAPTFRLHVRPRRDGVTGAGGRGAPRPAARACRSARSRPRRGWSGSSGPGATCAPKRSARRREVGDAGAADRATAVLLGHEQRRPARAPRPASSSRARSRRGARTSARTCGSGHSRSRNFRVVSRKNSWSSVTRRSTVTPGDRRSRHVPARMRGVVELGQRLAAQRAAVDRELRTGHVLRLVGRQVHDAGRDVGRLAEARHRDVRSPPPRRSRGVGEDRRHVVGAGVDEPDDDRVDADVVARRSRRRAGG